MAPRITIAFSLALGWAASSAHADPGHLGVMLDAGVPDGLTASLVYRPLRPLNLHAGIGTNLIGMGVRAGASLFLLPTTIAPSLNAEAGHYFAGDANTTMSRLGIDADSDSPVLREVGYDYANLQLGLDVGRDRMSFYIHAGFSFLRGTVHNLDEMVADEANDGLTVSVNKDPVATVVAPSARLGLVVFF